MRMSTYFLLVTANVRKQFIFPFTKYIFFLDKVTDRALIQKANLPDSSLKTSIIFALICKSELSLTSDFPNSGVQQMSLQ